MSVVMSLPGYAVVTGAASGMGQATAKALVAAGVFGIALLDVNRAGLEATHSLLVSAAPNSSRPPAIRTYICDVTSPESIDKTYKAVHAEFDRIDYSIHCAGIVIFGPSLSISIQDFDLQNSINCRGLWLCQRSVLTLMRSQTLNNEAYPEAQIPSYRAQRGAIVNIASVLAATNMTNTPAYSVAKAGVLSLTKSDALDYALDRVRINAVLPGMIDTPMTTPSEEMRKKMEEGPLQRTPVKRFGMPEEVADVMLFLCSTAASFVTGAGWAVDGGFLTN